MNRFLINLRSVDQQHPLSTSRSSLPQFRVPESILGNIGQFLTHGMEEDISSEDNMVNADSQVISEVPIVETSVGGEVKEPIASQSKLKLTATRNIKTIDVHPTLIAGLL
jgi:hypothetical protein